MVIFMVVPEWINLLLSLSIMMAFIYCWGKIKIKLALSRFSKAQKNISERRFREAVKQMEDLSGELKNDPDYWFCLGLALAGAGSKVDAEEALLRSLEIDEKHADSLELLDDLRR